MANYRTLGAFSADIKKLGRTLGNEGAKAIVKVMGDEAEKLARRAASADLGGDPKFSGWAPRLDDLQLKPIGTGKILLTPTRLSAGPWTVAESGRNQGNASGFSGPGVNRKTGVTARTKTGGLRKVRATKGKRWNGTTKGKDTASDSVAAINREMPKIAATELAKVINKFQ